MLILSLLIYPFCIHVDIDECSENLHNCDMNADCTDTDGSFTCTCRDGFEGDGTFCTSKKAILPSQTNEIVKSQTLACMLYGLFYFY